MKTEKIDFNGTSLNHWSHEGKITPEVIRDFLQYLCDLMQWLNTEGKTLLEREEPLTHKEYNLLVDKAFNLWFQIGSDRAISLLFMSVVKKGISSLRQAVEANPDNRDDEDGALLRSAHVQWFKSIQCQLSPGSRLGIGSRACRIGESRALIESMIPIARSLKSNHLMEELARDRFPNDSEAQKLYLERHMGCLR